MTRLALVRHGETVGNSSIRYYGRTDVPLSDLGRRQLRATAQALTATHGFTQFETIFASPLNRAIESARIITGAAAQIIPIAEFVEIDFGAFEGLTAQEILQRYPAEHARWRRGRLSADYAYPRGESRAAFLARVERGLARVARAFEPDARVLITAHRGVIRAITRALAGVEPVIELGSIQLLRRAPAGWQVEALDLTADPARTAPG